MIRSGNMNQIRKPVAPRQPPRAHVAPRGGMAVRGRGQAPQVRPKLSGVPFGHSLPQGGSFMRNNMDDLIQDYQNIEREE